MTEYLDGNGKQEIFLTQLPVIASGYTVAEDADGYYGDGTSSPFATNLTVGEDYVLPTLENPHQSNGGRLVRLNGFWLGQHTRRRGELTHVARKAFGSIKAVYFTGYRTIPGDVQAAVEAFCSRLLMTLPKGGGLASENLDYYAYTRVSAAEEADAIDSVKSMLGRHKTAII